MDRIMTRVKEEISFVYKINLWQQILGTRVNEFLYF